MAIRTMNRLIYLSLTNLLLVSAVINLLLELIIHLLIVLGQIKFLSRKVLDFKRIQLCFFFLNKFHQLKIIRKFVTTNWETT